MKNYTYPASKKDHYISFGKGEEKLMRIKKEKFLFTIYDTLKGFLPYFGGNVVSISCLYEIGEEPDLYIQDLTGKNYIEIPYDEILELDKIMIDAIVFNYSKNLKSVSLDIMFSKDDLTFNISYK